MMPTVSLSTAMQNKIEAKKSKTLKDLLFLNI